MEKTKTPKPKPKSKPKPNLILQLQTSNPNSAAPDSILVPDATAEVNYGPAVEIPAKASVLGNSDSQSTVSKIVLVSNTTPDLIVAPATSEPALDPVKAVKPAEPTSSIKPPVIVAPSQAISTAQPEAKKSPPVVAKAQPTIASDSWANLVKGSSKQLKKKGTTFTLDSDEACVRIPNGVIERNKKIVGVLCSRSVLLRSALSGYDS